MFEIDKEAFGAFLAEQRKAKGYTQKTLAEKLFVSDKAVSKWERGLSMPDISLLAPLSDILGISVTELLEGKKIDSASSIKTEEVETIVKKSAGAFGRNAGKSAAEEKKEQSYFRAVYTGSFSGNCRGNMVYNRNGRQISVFGFPISNKNRNNVTYIYRLFLVLCERETSDIL